MIPLYGKVSSIDCDDFLNIQWHQSDAFAKPALLFPAPTHKALLIAAAPPSPSVHLHALAQADTNLGVPHIFLAARLPLAK